MKIISLDQNVISNLAKNGTEPFWRDLREQLLAGVKAGKLLCPIPKETIVETIPCSRDVRIKIRNLQQQLSLGFSFKSFDAIEGQETLALVRSGISTAPYERIVWHSVDDDALAESKARDLQNSKDIMRRRMDAFIPPAGEDKLSVQEIRSGIITSRAASLYRQVERLLAGQPLDPSDGLEITLAQFLVTRGITMPELERLVQQILLHKWEAIPIVFFAAALGALLDHGRIRGRKYQPNDETDLVRVAIALHSSAMMITEKSIAYVARQLEKEFGENLDVLAISEREAIRASLELTLTA